MKWEKVSLESISTRIGDGLHGTPKYDDNGEFYFINGNNLSEGKILIKEDTKRISSIEYDKIKKELSEKTVLVAINGTLGNVGLYRDEPVALGKSACYINVNDKAEKLFVRYVLENHDFQRYAIDFATGSTIKNLGLKAVRDYSFNLPPLPTQRKIASILSAYDDLIENNLKRIKLLEEKASLMYKLMQKELLDADKKNLYDFANIQMGFAFKAEAFNEEGEGIPIIRIRDIPSQITKSYTTQEVDNQYWVEKGDLLIGMDGEFHMNEWLGQRGYLVQRVCRVRAKNELNRSYLWQALKEPIHFYETTISGATVAHLGKKHLEEIFITCPKESMKKELEELNTMRKLKIVLAEQNTKLREARDILLPKLMSGQIEV